MRHPGPLPPELPALLHRMRVPARWQRTPEPWLTRADDARALRRPGVVCRRGRLGPHEVVHIRGVAVTSPVRTFLDVCAELTVTEAVVLADGLVDAHRHGVRRAVAAVCRPDELETGVREHTGRRGVRTARAAVERMRVGSDSPGETRLRLLLEDHGIRGLVLDHPLLGPDGTLLAQPDLALESHRLSLQYEGAHHDRAEQRVLDIGRSRATESAGWRELRICADDLHRHTTTTCGPVPMAVALVWEAMGTAHRP